MAESHLKNISAREREVLEIIARNSEATARLVEREMDQPPSYSAVRSILRILVEKGYLTKDKRGKSDFYRLEIAIEQEGKKQLRDLVRNFFNGSVSSVASTLLSDREIKLSAEEADELIDIIRKAKQ